MNEHQYPMSPRELVKTMLDLTNHQKRTDLSDILQNSHPSLDFSDYDKWNGGTYSYILNLKTPASVYSRYFDVIEKLQEELSSYAAHIDKAYENDHIRTVAITVVPDDAHVFGQRLIPSEEQTKHIWEEGLLKLFISHLAAHKIQVHKLKTELKKYGVDAFVAHDDIEPTKKWQEEIELALRSMEALAALVTPGFIESKWCDQEVGWAMGRAIQIIPVRLGADPYGFAGGFQAISGALDKPYLLAKSIFQALKSNPSTKNAIYRALPRALMNSGAFVRSQELAPVICEYSDYTQSEKETLWKACESNSQVINAWGVCESIYKHIGKPPSKKSAETSELPF